MTPGEFKIFIAELLDPLGILLLLVGHKRIHPAAGPLIKGPVAHVADILSYSVQFLFDVSGKASRFCDCRLGAYAHQGLGSSFSLRAERTAAGHCWNLCHSLQAAFKRPLGKTGATLG